jgi:hypothetical protein
MKQIYGFLDVVEGDWEDFFVDEKKSPEYKISSACHIYYDVYGVRIIGFDLSLNIPMEEMRELLQPYSNDLSIRKGI